MINVAINITSSYFPQSTHTGMGVEVREDGAIILCC